MNPKFLLATIMKSIKEQQAGKKVSNGPLDIFKMLMAQYGIHSDAATFEAAFDDFEQQAVKKGMAGKVAKMKALLPSFKDRKINGISDMFAVLNEMMTMMGGDVISDDDMADLQMMQIMLT